MDSEKDTCQSKEKGKDNSHRVWTKTEENVLLDILEDIVKTGGRADNGQFKSESNLKIYNHLHTVLLGWGLKIQPHIESKLKAMKQEYHIICDMLQGTGLGWNADLQCVEAETEAHWEKYMQKAPKHKGYRNKPVPNFDRYGLIFGKDRATGEGAEGPADAVENIEAEGNNEMNMSTSVTQATQSQPSSRKRVRSSNSLATSMKDMRSMIEVYVGSIQKSMVDVADKLGEATNRLSKDRRLLFEELKKLPNLSPREQLVVARKIRERPDYVDLFFSADDEFKKDFIAMLLEDGC